MHVAIDIGGTFTDAVAIDDYGIIKTAKSSTTHENLTIGAINSLKALKINFNQVSSFVHGTTAGLNALLERRGGKVALITTKGFRDIYEIGRANRPEIYNFRYKRQKTLLNRCDIFEIDERIGADGSIIKSINKEKIINLLKKSIKNKYVLFKNPCPLIFKININLLTKCFGFAIIYTPNRRVPCLLINEHLSLNILSSKNQKILCLN